MNYQLQNHPWGGEPVVIKKINDDGSFIWIPYDQDNTDYVEYLKWLEEGNEPLPADLIPEPEPLTAQQKLEAAGLTVEELKELLGL